MGDRQALSVGKIDLQGAEHPFDSREIDHSPQREDLAPGGMVGRFMRGGEGWIPGRSGTTGGQFGVVRERLCQR